MTDSTMIKRNLIADASIAIIVGSIRLGKQVVQTVKHESNKARLLVTFEFEFPKEVLALQPPHLRDATDLLRKMLEDSGGAEAWEDDFTDMIGSEIEYSGILAGVKVEVGC